MSTEILRVADRVDVPWRNGAGVTSEILVSPGDGDFDWRLSIATVDSDAPFSTFGGVDRCLLALSEQGLDLVDAGRLVRLGAFESHTFAGENEVASFGVTRPTLDLNLMTRRDRCSGTLESYPVAGSCSVAAGPGESVVVVIVGGSFTLGGQPLAMFDAVRLDEVDTAAPVPLHGVGQLAVARVERR
ncbi:HutD family protein [Cryobacterium sp. N19]|uniref:HutD/Ves family protein n=1 Tax=Cryobacterium sp. N19 TaxID=2048288 RepID=UPI000CE53310|nr:HutD family protein [Cryobacterium sp. N19]